MLDLLKLNIYLSKDEFSYMEILKSFIQKNKTNLPINFNNWITNLLIPSIEWTFEYLNQTIMIGFPFLINNIISHISEAKTETQFLISLYYGLRPFIQSNKQIDFVNKVYI